MSNSDSEDRDSTRPISALIPGQTVKNYLIERKLGQGGMGEVYLAQDQTLRRKVALKFLSDYGGSTEAAKQRFLQEARAAAALNHPNIVSIYEVGEFQQRAFISMEYVEGTSLQTLATQGEMPVESVVQIALQVCAGLKEAHSLGITHRDIKPANIVVDSHDRVRIVDFGLASITGASHLTNAGQAIGTPMYMSPEQILSEAVDQRTDLFSLGATLFELLGGRSPFKRDSYAATLNAVLNDEPEKLSGIRSDIPTGLLDVVSKLLEKSPANRYQSAADVAADLERLSSGKTLEIHKSRRRRRTRMAIALMLVAIIVAAVSIKIINSRSAGPQVKSLAILYLRNVGQADGDPLCYGLTDDLITTLTHIGTLRVVPTREILALKDSLLDVRQLARRLDVQYLLDASFLRSESGVRVSAQLIDAKSGKNVWADNWTTEQPKIPSLLKTLARGICAALSIGESAMAATGADIDRTRNPQAYELYLQGKYGAFHAQDSLDVQKAIVLLDSAVAIDSTLLEARLELCNVYLQQGLTNKAQSTASAVLDEARRLGRKTEEIGALVRLSNIESTAGNVEEALRYTLMSRDNALELGDRSAYGEALSSLGIIYIKRGNNDSALSVFTQVLAIDSLLQDRSHMAKTLTNMGVIYVNIGDRIRAREIYRSALEIAEAISNLRFQSLILIHISITFDNGLLDEIDSCLCYSKAALEIAQRLNNKPLVGDALSTLGGIEFMKGNCANSIDYRLQTATMAKEMHDHYNYLFNMTMVAINYTVLGQYTKAENLLLELERDAVALGDSVVLCDILTNLGSTQLYQGRSGDAFKTFRRAWPIYELKQPGFLGQFMVAMGSSFLDEGKYDSARIYLNQAVVLSDSLGDATNADLARQCSAALSAYQQGDSLSFADLRKRVANTQKSSFFWGRVDAKRLLGWALMERGKTQQECDEGLSLLREALANSREKGLAPEIQIIEKLLRHYGATQ